jgi:hypothetical protein
MVELPAFRLTRLRKSHSTISTPAAKPSLSPPSAVTSVVAAPAELVEALGAVSTILGVGKDTLVTTYVTLAVRAKEPGLDVVEPYLLGNP